MARLPETPVGRIMPFLRGGTPKARAGVFATEDALLIFPERPEIPVSPDEQPEA